MAYSFVTAFDGDPFVAPIAQARHVNPAPDRFMFATGIECSAPTIKNGRLRRDLLEECGHYDRWQEDLLLVRDLGLTYLRYGLPYHKIHLGPGRYDWSFADVVMHEMQRLGIVPILDLLHFGVPDWLGNFQNPELPLHFGNYTQAVARRYPWVRYFTPINEIYVTARISAKDGMWNEQLRTDRGFVTALKHLVAANILATHGIVAVTPDAVLIPSESAEYMHEGRLHLSAKAVDFNRQRFISLDLLYGRSCDDQSRTYLLENGMTVAEYEWFMTSPRSGHHILGIDYYGRNEHIVSPTGRRMRVEDVFGLYAMAREYYDRYRMPLMHTETNMLRGKDCPAWLWKQWMNIVRLRRDGVPILGFTWYSLVDQIDWNIALSKQRGTVNQCGLFNLDRRPNPVAAEYRIMVQEFGNLPLYPVETLLPQSNQNDLQVTRLAPPPVTRRRKPARGKTLQVTIATAQQSTSLLEAATPAPCHPASNDPWPANVTTPPPPPPASPPHWRP